MSQESISQTSAAETTEVVRQNRRHLKKFTGFDMNILLPTIERHLKPKVSAVTA